MRCDGKSNLKLGVCGQVPTICDLWLRLVVAPSYIAPEMLNGSSDISARTDVYLLGGLLHEVLVHAPRHAGNVLSVVLVSVFESLPFAYDATVPCELAMRCNRATAHDAVDRFESALAFRAAPTRNG